MISNREVIDRIDSRLKQMHLKRNAVYDAVGLPHNTFSNWSKQEGIKIPVQPLYSIARYLGISLEYLLTGDECTQSPVLEIPQDILDTAYKIYTLPDIYRKIVFDIVETLIKNAEENQ